MNKVYRAIADPTRRKVLELLREGDLAAGEIAEHFDMAQPSLSRHLAVLREADLIHGEKHGNRVIYHLNVSVLEEALLLLMERYKLNGGSS